jgi:hypothetical protein
LLASPFVLHLTASVLFLFEENYTDMGTACHPFAQQKIVIKVAMPCDKCRSKAMALVAKTRGVDSVSIAGDAKDQVVVVGESVDSVKLTSALRKKVGPAHLVEVADDSKKEKQKKQDATAPEYQFYCHYPAPQPATVVYEYPASGYAYGYQCGSANTCSIM